MTHTTTGTVALLDCGHVRPVHAPGYVGGDGVARRVDGSTLCYPCADAEQFAGLPTRDDVYAYVASDGRTVMTWSGGRLMVITHGDYADNGWNGSRVYSYRATAEDGSRWYGRNGGAGMCIRMRRSTATPRA